jgi:methyl-accepting chemotaxis protein
MTFRRRKYLTDTNFQMKIILTFVLISFLVSITAVAFFNFFAIKEFDAIMWSTHINVQSTSELLRPLFIKVNIIGFIVVSILTVIAAVLIIRRASGPLYRMSKDMERAAGGDLSLDIALRQKDEFKDIANDLDIVMQSIRERFQFINDEYPGISRTLAKIQQNKMDSKDYSIVFSGIERLEKKLAEFTVAKQ